MTEIERFLTYQLSITKNGNKKQSISCFVSKNLTLFVIIITNEKRSNNDWSQTFIR